MDDRKIDVLLSAVQTGSFNKAAQAQNCTQSAVTQMMNALEAELGFKVLDRSHRGITLTPEGEELLPLIIETQNSMQRLRTQAKRIAEGASAPVRIGSFSSISNAWLPHAIRAYQEIDPEVSFDIRIGTEVLSEWLLEGKIDLALGDAERCKGFRFFPLMDDPYSIAAPRGMFPENTSVVHQDELTDKPFISSSSNALDSYLSNMPSNCIQLVCDDDSTLLTMVSQGIGATALPSLSLHNVPEEVHVMDMEPAAVRVLGVALPNSPRLAAEDFAEFLQKRYPYAGAM